MIYIVNQKNKLTDFHFFAGFSNKEDIMNSREILIYLAIKFEGDWDSIYSAINIKEEFDEKEAMKMIK